MTHTHDFHRIGEVSKFPDGTTAETMRQSLPRQVQGVEVGCVNCGQTRRVYADGNVEIESVGRGPIMDEDAPPSGDAVG